MWVHVSFSALERAISARYSSTQQARNGKRNATAQAKITTKGTVRSGSRPHPVDRRPGDTCQSRSVNDDILSVINSETSGQASNFIEAYAEEHDGCALLDFAQREFASGAPWGKRLAEWTDDDVESFRLWGRVCIATDPRNAPGDVDVFTEQFDRRYQNLEAEVAQARDDQAVAVAEEERQRQQAKVAAEAQVNSSDVASQLDDWLRDYKTMPPNVALAQANELLAAANRLTGDAYTTEIWDLTSSVMYELSGLEDAARRATAHNATRPGCYNALAAIGQAQDWSRYPMWFDGPEFNLGDFLCWFLRTDTLGNVLVGEGTVDVLIDGIGLHFEPRKNIATDDYYAAPEVAANGEVRLAIIWVDANGQRDKLTTFSQHIQVMSAIMTYKGAPFVE